MSDTPTNREPPADRILNVTVRRIISAGLIVSLPDGREGLIRERELAWSVEARQGWRERYKPDDSLQAVVLKSEDGQRPELSLRLAQDDPWLDVEERCPTGALVDGVVTGIMPYGIFVELEPGVTGLVHRSRFPSWVRGEPGAVFWPGDRVKVEILRLDPKNRKLSFDMQRLGSWRWQHATAQGSRQFRSAREDTSIGSTRLSECSLLPIERLILHGAKTILIADDNERQRHDIADWFRHAGQQVLTAADGEEAVQIAQRSAPHLAVIDINMPGMNGLAAVQQIREVSPTTRCILITGESEVDCCGDELNDLRQDSIRVFAKPVLPDELLDVLYDASGSTHSKVASTQLADTYQADRAAVRHEQLDRHWLSDTLTRLRVATRSSQVILFSLDIGSRQVGVAAQSGRPLLRAGMLPDLIHSPVRDVAEDGATVCARDPSEANGRRFLYMRPYVRFTACVGVPVKNGDVNPQALFLFFNEPLPTTDTIQAQASLAAIAIEAKLESKQLMARAAGIHRQAMIGQLTDVLTHELNNQRDIIPRTQRLLRDQLRDVRRDLKHSPAALPGALDDVEGTIQDFIRELDELTGVVERLSGLGESEQLESVFLSEIIEEAASLLRFSANKHRILIETSDTTRLSYIHTLRVSVRHVLINVILNAIMQLRNLNRDTGGRIQVRLESGDGKDFRITVEDDGPGIHRRLWEQIFDLGFTTRPGGRGLGLYVSRKLLDAFGARIYVRESFIAWGSTFVIELSDLPSYKESL